MPETSQLSVDDLAPGMIFAGATNTVTDRGFRAFADITGDAHPIHYDAAYAARTRFGKPVAHGLLVAGMTALGATPLAPRFIDTSLVMLEVGFRFRRPVFAGDTVTSEFEVEEVKRSPEKGKGVVRFKVRLRNAAGEIAAEGFHAYLLQPRADEA